MQYGSDAVGEQDIPAVMLTDFRQEVCQHFERLLARLDRQDIMLDELVKQCGDGNGKLNCDALQPWARPCETAGELAPTPQRFSQVAKFDIFPPADHGNEMKPKTSVSKIKEKEREATSMQSVTRSTSFELFFGVLIVLNAIWIGVELEYQIKSPTLESLSQQSLVTQLFSLAFLIELVARIVAEKAQFFYGRKDLAWNYFDLILVSVSTTEFVFFAISTYTDLTVNKGGPSFQNLRLIRIVRTMRFLRLLRMARILRFIRALRVLVHSIMTTLKSLIWAMFLLTIIMYVFAILFTRVVNDYLLETNSCFGPACFGDEGDMWRMFGTIPRSMFTLFKSLSNGIDWGACTEILADVDGTYVAAFVTFIAFSYFAVLNVVTGVFCQKAIESAHRDRELAISTLMENKEAHITNIRAQFGKMFTQIDADNSGFVSFEEFQRHMDEDSVSAFFILLDVDPSDAYALFKLLDDDGSGSIDADEFVDGCLRLQGQAKSIDLAKIRHETRNMLKGLHNSNVNQWNRSHELMYRHERQLLDLASKINDVVAAPTNRPCAKEVGLISCPGNDGFYEYVAGFEDHNFVKTKEAMLLSPRVMDHPPPMLPTCLPAQEHAQKDGDAQPMCHA